LNCMLRALAEATIVLTAVNSPAQERKPDEYPSKPVRIIVPSAPGGGIDIIGRIAAQKLSETWGQQVIVDNRGGANGNIGMEFVAKSPADGYTLLFALTAQYAINPSLYPKLSYDPLKDNILYYIKKSKLKSQ